MRFFNVQTASRASLFCFLLFNFLSSIRSQQLELKIHPDYQVTQYHLGKDQGLKGNLPYGFLQDQKDYIWIVVNGWVQRYNGTKFETFLKLQTTYEMTTELIEDAQGRIWVFNYHNNQLPHHHIELEEVKLISVNRDQIQDQAVVWAAYGFDFDNNMITAIGKNQRNGAVLLGLKDGRLIEVSDKARLVGKWPHIEPVSFIETNESGNLCLAGPDRWIVVDTLGKLLDSHIFEKPLVRVALDQDNGVIYDFPEEPVVHYWALSDTNQLFIPSLGLGVEQIAGPLNLTKAGFLIQKNEIFKIGQKSPLIQCPNCPRMYQDYQNNIWTSDYNGLTVIQLRPRWFKTLLTKYGAETRGILLLRDSLLLVHSFKGTFIVDWQDSVRQHNPKMRANIGVAKDAAGRVWQGLYGGKLEYIPDYQRSLTSISRQDERLIKAGNNVVTPFVSLQGVLWLGQNRGLGYCLSGSDGLPEKCILLDDPDLLEATVHHLQEVNRRLWAATSKGLFEIDLLAHKVVAHPAALERVNITHFAVDGRDVWFSTMYQGLIKWEYGASFYQDGFLRTDTLLPETVPQCAVYDDSLGYLWVPTFQGLFRLNKNDLSYQVFYHEQHIAHNEFNLYSHTRLPDGRLALGGLNGITLVDPKLIANSETKPVEFFLALDNEIISNNQRAEAVSLQNGKPVSLTGQRDNLQFECSILDFRSNARGTIMYRLQGLQEDWQLSENRQIRLERIPFGNYILQVKAKSFDNVLSANEWNIPVYARKPWYLTNGAIVLALVSIFAGGVGIMRFRYRSIRQAKKYLEALVRQRTAEIEAKKDLILTQHEELKNLNEYKNKVMAIIGHDLRGPLLGLDNLGKKMNHLAQKGQIDRLLRMGSDTEIRIRYLRDLVDNLLAWSLVQNKNNFELNRSKTALATIAQDQINLLETLSKDKGQKIHFETGEEIILNVQKTIIAVLIRNLLANAIRYSGNDTDIRIQITTYREAPCIIIEDQGPGMPQIIMQELNQHQDLKKNLNPVSEEGVGLGLWICSSLLQGLRARWHFEPADAEAGLRVRLWFPNLQTLEKV